MKKTSKVSAAQLSSEDPNWAQVCLLCDWWDEKAIPHLGGLARREDFMIERKIVMIFTKVCCYVVQYNIFFHIFSLWEAEKKKKKKTNILQ